MENKKILDIKNLEVSFKNKKSEINVIRNVSFHLDEYEILGIVGESGSGKSVTMKSIMNILPESGYIKNGEIEFDGKNLRTLDKKDFREIQGKEIAMIFQDPMTALNPLKTIGFHLIENIQRHQKIDKKDAKEKSIKLLEMVGINNADTRFNAYPHEFSGGQRQRVMIAMGLSNNPKLLIADEPTTALDVTVQAQVLKLIKRLQVENGMSVILITHDLSVVYEICDRVIVMYGGKIMEEGKKDEIFSSPRHPYTKALLNSIPTLETKKGELKSIEGMAPSISDLPKGCPFEPRCPRKIKECSEKSPEIEVLSDSHIIYCYNKLEDLNGGV